MPVRTIRDGESKTATSTFTQLLSSVTKSVVCMQTVISAFMALQNSEVGKINR